ncbi:O-antigen ligase family protein [Actinomadura sp. 9N407]|uniref:O-antigen ligase family protein n=1 Tax=Actinomadura sp. 9N407 TaxID=3375154 RepID=UPI0037BBC993
MTDRPGVARPLIDRPLIDRPENARPENARPLIGALVRRPGWLVAAAALAICLPSPPQAGAGSGDAAVAITPADVASAVLVAAAAVLVVTGKAAPPPRTLLAFGPAAAALGLATLCSQDIDASLTGFVRVAQLFVLVPVAVTAIVRDRTDALLVAGAVVVAGLFQAAYGIWQVFTGTGASFAGENVRAVGTFGAGDVMALSVVTGFGLIITLAFVLASARRWVRPLALAAMAVLALALVLALSRGSWIAIAAAAGLVLVAFDRRVAWRTAVAGVALLVVTVGGLGIGTETLTARAQSMARITESPDQSVIDRYSLWTAASGIWQDHPLTGVGVKNFPAYRDSYAPIDLSAAGETADPVHGYKRQPLLSPHSQYLLVLSEQGLVGFAGLLALFGTLLYGLWTRRDPRDPLWLASAGFLAALLTNFVYADMSGPSSVLVAILIGLVAARSLGGSPAGTRSRGEAR